ncbi:MAG: nitrite reductase (NAD(P)H) small subunit [Planctomycetes bacterium]|nr:nitrite reductase (NAD(P)H) small subunit [Planctomycetota bacterium]
MGKPKGESRGLAYLQKARPAAMQHLLKFFAESARHLDPKTRFLISIVTKVISASHRGVEQYVKRALEAGATPQEVVDAVLCAYPCAGLTRVVDAIDAILDMGLPGFEEIAAEAQAPAAAQAPAEARSGDPGAARAAPQGSRWVEVAAAGEIPPGGALHVLAGPREIGLFSVEGKMHAIDHVCPHKKGPLARGTVVDGIVTCPLHGWTFRLETGECVSRPGARVAVYPVRVNAAGKVEVLLSSP